MNTAPKLRSIVNKTLKKLTILIILPFTMVAQDKKYQSATVGFYNLENLFDIYESVGYVDGTKDYQDQFYHVSVKRDDIPNLDTVYFKSRMSEENIKDKKIIRELILQKEFTPNGPKAFDATKYNQKLTNLSTVISRIGKDITNSAPVAVGVVEIENRQVLQDLIDQPALKPYNYGVVHYNSWDKRGIDCGFIYQKDRVQVTGSKKYEVIVYNVDGNRDYTRDILRVDALLDGEPIHFIVNHWPSRRGGEAASAPKRAEAARVLKSIFEEIEAEEPNAKIIAMGDLNDDPVSPSVKKVLGAKLKQKQVKNGDIFTPMGKMYKDGKGTLAYRDRWNLFDIILLSSSLVGDDYNKYQVYKTDIFSPSYLISREGQYKGYPNRMYGGDSYRANGYSDHFPVYTILLREVGE